MLRQNATVCLRQQGTSQYYLSFVFALCERKNERQKKEKYHCE